MNAYRLRPSAAASWILCGASVSLRAMYPDESGEAAEVGTAAHWVAQLMLTAKWDGSHRNAPNGVAITKEIISGAKQYYQHVKEWGIPVYVEQPLDCHDIHEECGGTPDVWGYDWIDNIIRLCDFKFGFQLVDAYENWQLLCYLAGILSKLRAQGIDTSRTRVELSVCQPRVYRLNGGAEPWKFNVCDAQRYFDRLIVAAYRIIDSDAPPRAVVGSQCDYCSANRACVTLQTSGYVATELSGQPHLLDLTTEQASQELARLEHARDVLLSRIGGLSAQVESALWGGQSSPLYDLERTRKRLIWSEGMHAEVATLAKFYGKDVTKPIELITPTQALSAGLDAEVVSQYSYRPTGENKLVRKDIKQIRNFTFGEK